MSQALFALGHARLAALGWLVGLLVSAACMALLGVGLLQSVSYSLALGTFVAAVVQAAFYISEAAGGRRQRL